MSDDEHNRGLLSLPQTALFRRHPKSVIFMYGKCTA